MMLLGNGRTIGIIITIASSAPNGDTLAIAASGATVAIGPVKLVKLANGPSAKFTSRPNVDEKLPCG